MCVFQIGKCRLAINIKHTREFYAGQPSIKQNCSCGYCKYFEEVVVKEANRFWALLKDMGVDLNRQPNINPDGLCCVGEVKPGKVGYLGYYIVFGAIGKTPKKSAKFDAQGDITEVYFNDTEFGEETNVTIKKLDNDRICFEFYIEVQYKSL